MLAKQGERLLRLSLFDFLLSIFLIGLMAVRWPGQRVEMAQGMWFCVGTFALLAASQLQDHSDILWRSPWLGGFVIWALVHTFIIHSTFDPESPVAWYVGLYALLGGGIYIVCGAILVALTANYTKTNLPMWSLLLICLASLIIKVKAPETYGLMLTPSQLGFLGAICVPVAFTLWKPLVIIPVLTLFFALSYTPILAASIATIGIAFWRKSWTAWVLLAAMLAFVVWKESMLWQRFAIRPEVWKMTWDQIWTHPFFGSGFDLTLNSPMVLSSQGWVYRHNDLLSLWKDMGLPAAVLAVGFLRSLWRGSWVFDRWVLSILALGMLFQTQASFPRMMGPVCVIIGLCASNRKAAFL